MNDIVKLTALELSKHIHSREISCVEVMTQFLSRIEELNPTYNAIVALADTQNLLDQSKTADEQLTKNASKGWMHGFPFAVKDLADVTGFVTSYGSSIFKHGVNNNAAKQDSLPVARIRSAGAIFIGKTNVPEFGLGSQSYNPVYGVTGNAFNPDWTSGGSSGGAATALATNMLPIADGSDMMGSLRNPAAFNNIIGFRPTQGVIPLDAGDVFSGRLASAGPMGRNIADTRALFNIMAGEDLTDPYSIRGDLPASNQTQQPMKLGWLGNYDGYLPTEPGVLELCESSLAKIDKDQTIVESCIPDFSMAQVWEAWLVLRQWSVAGKYRHLYDNHRALLKPELVWEVEQGLKLTAWDVSQANVIRSDFYRAMHKLFEQYDFLALPSAQVFPFDKSIHWPKDIHQTQMDTYHRWMEVVIAASLMGCPVINVPAGFAGGRPMGIQILAPVGSDLRLLDFAERFETIAE